MLFVCTKTVDEPPEIDAAALPVTVKLFEPNCKIPDVKLSVVTEALVDKVTAGVAPEVLFIVNVPIVF